MKIGGKTYNKPKEVKLYLQRDDGSIEFTFVAVNDEDGVFEKLFPEPQAPRVFKRALGETVSDVTDKEYLKKRGLWASAKTDWMFLQSISPSGIEWDTVDLSDAGTFGNWKADLVKAGFSVGERNAIWDHFVKANMMTDDMLKEARESFLVGRELALLRQSLSSQNIEQSNTQSGKSASDGESSPQV